jgi:type IV pilus assembly protein PilF
LRAQLRWPVVGVILTLAFFLITGCAANKALTQKQGRASRDLGERFLARNQPSQALEQFLKAYELIPDDPYLQYDLALAYDYKGALDKAEYHAREAIKLKPDYSNAYNYLGTIYYRQGRMEEAIEAFEKALSNLLYMSPQDAQRNLGGVYLALKQYHEAIIHLKEAIRLVPDFVPALNDLGKAYEGLKMYGEARRAYEKALEYNPEYVGALLNMGEFLYRSGDKQKSKEYFEKVIRAEPGSDSANEARSYLGAMR